MRDMNQGYQRFSPVNKCIAATGIVHAASGKERQGVDSSLRFPYARVVPSAPLPQRHRLPPLKLIFVVWLVPALLSGFDTYMQSRLNGNPPPWRWVVFNSLDWLLYAVLTPVVFRASRRFPVRRGRLAETFVLHFAGALLMCIAWAGLGTILRAAIFYRAAGFDVSKLLTEFLSWTFTTLPFGAGVYFALLGIEHALFFMAEARERETQAARLEAQLSEARLGALRMQLNPHFLFNSLNAITVLVRDSETAAASRMLELLSELLRQVLRAEPGHETTVSDELAFIGRYLEIEKVRFSDRLRPRIEVDPAVASAGVPRFILQPLVENALRHGIARRSDAGLLEVTARREGNELVLRVRDDGPGLRDSSAIPGVGLLNTRSRLAALYGDRGSLDIAGAAGGGVLVTVRLPYHEIREDVNAQ
jgi:two-component system, LytTR family, sensor kinase